MAAWPDRHYGSVFGPGCSIGLLTRLLAGRSDPVLAMDVSAAALQQARAGLPPNVELQQGSVPADRPSGRNSTSSYSPSWATTSMKKTATNWPPWP